MNGNEVLRIVDSIHRDKSIDKEIVFEGVEQAILSAARKHFGEEEVIEVHIDRTSGQPMVKTNGREIDRDELGDILGRISAQTAKQVMIQKIREAERDTLFDEYAQLRGQIVSGTVTRNEGSAITVNIGKAEAILPRSEMIPGESHRPNERIRAVVLEVKKMGPRVRVVLSRAHPDFVRRLLELEIPEVNERIIEIRSLAREAGYRTKVAVSCADSNIDPVGACVGVRGARIRNVGEELGGERIEVVRWNDSLQVLVPNAMQPSEVEDVILCPMLGRVLVLVRDDQLSLAIGKRGQNVRLASKLVGWDIDVMTREELDQQLDQAVVAYSQIPGVSEELAEGLVSQGFLSFEDLSVIEPDELMEMGSLTQEQADVIVEYAERESERIEKEQDLRRATEKAERQSQEREQRRADEARASNPAVESKLPPAADNEASVEEAAGNKS
ncbi:transcription termination factor NusA [Planctopirus limnophila DSM 3776]|uniref:Transcription termination/antitermination protein NusA n=1 Tax=Planctopirus limnophila (strain ATCC 43296 / DSM 3776 / IFAM 1008 / Mu 290) TaxID=521674 RepID=D5SQ09_PLAL2|nr:transcription termination factor NusA [Planctopirus limnophila]ADG68384.1 transcription termination factor NusA [Planctopirus limnophila DSM 3776]